MLLGYICEVYKEVCDVSTVEESAATEEEDTHNRKVSSVWYVNGAADETRGSTLNIRVMRNSNIWKDFQTLQGRN